MARVEELARPQPKFFLLFPRSSFFFLVLTDMLSQGLPKSDIRRQAVSKVGSFFGVDLFLKNI